MKPIMRILRIKRETAMKKIGYLGLAGIVLLSLMLTISSTWAQSSKRLHYSTLFNSGTVGTLSGEVVQVAQAPSGNGADYCVQAVLRTPKGNITAILLPKVLWRPRGSPSLPRTG
jgi:hypothetical protein